MGTSFSNVGGGGGRIIGVVDPTQRYSVIQSVGIFFQDFKFCHAVSLLQNVTFKF
jgi:hypothetical protein